MKGITIYTLKRNSKPSSPKSKAMEEKSYKTYIFFNNCHLGFAPKNALALKTIAQCFAEPPFPTAKAIFARIGIFFRLNVAMLRRA